MKLNQNGDRNHRNQRRMAIPCNCGAEAGIRTSWSKANRGKLYYACTIKGPNCDRIGWVNDHKYTEEDNSNGDENEVDIMTSLGYVFGEHKDCCKHFRMKLEAENQNLKLLLFISWMFFCPLLCTNYRCRLKTDHCNPFCLLITDHCNPFCLMKVALDQFVLHQKETSSNMPVNGHMVLWGQQLGTYHFHKRQPYTPETQF
ncbi:hypothetical protein LXL04_007105 [Taraxacum kok-saghyz]